MLCFTFQSNLDKNSNLNKTTKFTEEPCLTKQGSSVNLIVLFKLLFLSVYFILC
jgi:hypothetical protein